MSEVKKPAITGGMWNRKGHFVPDSVIDTVDRDRDTLVRSIYDCAKAWNDDVVAYKETIAEDVDGFCKKSAEEYGVKVGGVKGNFDLYSFDGSIKITVQVQETIAFDERLNTAKELIDECTSDWTADGRDEVKVLIQDAFDSKDGRLSRGKVLGLRKFHFEDDRWNRAMDAISKSIQVTGSKRHIRIYVKNENTGKMEPLALFGGNL